MRIALLFLLLPAVAPGQSTIWPSSTVPAPAATGSGAVSLGVRFRADIAGTVTAIRFYKLSSNTGTHIGNIWTDTGTLIGSVTFAGETASGWQQQTLTTPVSITANTVYVVSYFSPNGFSGYTANGLANGVDSPPLHAVSNAIEPNGLYTTGSNVFPTSTYQASNYWVDLVFTPGTPPQPPVSCGGVTVSLPLVISSSCAISCPTCVAVDTGGNLTLAGSLHTGISGVGYLLLQEGTCAAIANPSVGTQITFFNSSTHTLNRKDSTGTCTQIGN